MTNLKRNTIVVLPAWLACFVVLTLASTSGTRHQVGEGEDWSNWFNYGLGMPYWLEVGRGDSADPGGHFEYEKPQVHWWIHPWQLLFALLLSGVPATFLVLAYRLRRRYSNVFQVSLLTCFLLMVTAALILAINFFVVERDLFYEIRKYGWPWPFYTASGGLTYKDNWSKTWNGESFICDAGLALLILLVVACISEVFVRRRWPNKDSMENTRPQ